MGVFLNRYLYQVCVIKYIRLLVHRVRHQCYKKWLLVHDVKTGNKNFDDRFPQGEVLARIMNDTEAIRELITSGTFGIFIDLPLWFLPWFPLSLLTSAWEWPRWIENFGGHSSGLGFPLYAKDLFGSERISRPSQSYLC